MIWDATTMKSRNILLADNDPVFLDNCAEYLESFGYRVVKAANPVEARDILETSYVHLAILDLRLTNDDEKDRSGLMVAKKYAPSIPKIILTKFPAHEDVRDAMMLEQGPLPPAVDFVDKRKDLSALLEAVNQAFALHIHINWDLVIEWKEDKPFGLVNRIEPTIEGVSLLSRVEEFEDLFYRLFGDKNQIRVERLLWEHDRRVALIVFAFKEGMKPESFIVVCGQNAVVNREVQRYKEFAPKAPGDTAIFLSEKTKAETTHFAANVYALAGNDLEEVQTLADLYRLGPEKIFNTALKYLYQVTLKSWHQEKPISERGSTPNVLYSERLHLTNLDPQQLEARISAVESQIPRLNARISQTSETLSVHFKNHTFTHQHPIRLFRQIIESEQLDLFITVPGVLSGDNILVDKTGRTWLTDFAEAGLAPTLWNFVTMEAIIRFDWVETKELQRIYELERSFVFTDFAKPDIRDLEPVMRKAARAIQTIRKLAARTIGNDVVAYQQGLFLIAARRLADFDPIGPVTATELARLGHSLLSMAMIGEILDQEKKDNRSIAPVQSERIRILDEKARIVMVGNRRERLTPQNFVLFKYLYDKANQICSKEELLKEVLKDAYDDGYLHTLVGRIRKTIEDDPENPRFLVTELNAGYRLILKPK